MHKFKLEFLIKQIKPNYTVFLILCLFLSGCDYPPERNYEYYVANPHELEYDYTYCKRHSKKHRCYKVIDLYIKYHRNIEALTANPKNSTFFDIDMPINHDDLTE